MLPLNMVIPAVNRAAASLFLGATDAVSSRTPLCISYKARRSVSAIEAPQLWDSVSRVPDTVLLWTSSPASRDLRCVFSGRELRRRRT
jgi:hypothetical protein